MAQSPLFGDRTSYPASPPDACFLSRFLDLIILKGVNNLVQQMKGKNYPHAKSIQSKNQNSNLLLSGLLFVTGLKATKATLNSKVFTVVGQLCVAIRGGERIIFSFITAYLPSRLDISA